MAQTAAASRRFRHDVPVGKRILVPPRLEPILYESFEALVVADDQHALGREPVFQLNS